MEINGEIDQISEIKKPNIKLLVSVLIIFVIIVVVSWIIYQGVVEDKWLFGFISGIAFGLLALLSIGLVMFASYKCALAIFSEQVGES